MKVQLLSDGGFKGMEGVDFANEFDGIACYRDGALSGVLRGVEIKIKDLIKAGAHDNLAVLNDFEVEGSALYFSNGKSGLFTCEYKEL